MRVWMGGVGTEKNVIIKIEKVIIKITLCLGTVGHARAIEKNTKLN